MDAFTKFAPAYFDYMRSVIETKVFQFGSTIIDTQRPTVLAKTYGLFKISYRNGVTGRTLKMNLIVMENLFYERQFQKVRGVICRY